MRCSQPRAQRNRVFSSRCLISLLCSNLSRYQTLLDIRTRTAEIQASCHLNWPHLFPSIVWQSPQACLLQLLRVQRSWVDMLSSTAASGCMPVAVSGDSMYCSPNARWQPWSEAKRSRKRISCQSNDYSHSTSNRGV